MSKVTYKVLCFLIKKKMTLKTNMSIHLLYITVECSSVSSILNNSPRKKSEMVIIYHLFYNSVLIFIQFNSIIMQNMSVVFNRLRRYYKGRDKLIYNFFFAIKVGDVDLIRGYLNLDKTLLCSLYERGSTPLHYASVHGHLQLVKIFEIAGININEPDNHQNTALHMSFRENHLLVSKYLLSRGANVEHKNWIGQTPLHVCYSVQELQFLLHSGVSINSIDYNGYSALRGKDIFFSETLFIFAIKLEFVGVKINEQVVSELLQKQFTANVNFRILISQLSSELNVMR